MLTPSTILRKSPPCLLASARVSRRPSIAATAKRFASATNAVIFSTQLCKLLPRTSLSDLIAICTDNSPAATLEAAWAESLMLLIIVAKDWDNIPTSSTSFSSMFTVTSPRATLSAASTNLLIGLLILRAINQPSPKAIAIDVTIKSSIVRTALLA